MIQEINYKLKKSKNMKTSNNNTVEQMDAIIKRDMIILKTALVFLGTVLNVCILQLVF